MNARATCSARSHDQAETSAVISSPGRRGLRRSPVGGRTGGDHRVPQPLDVGEQVRPGGLADHLAEHLAEQPDVPAHRLGQLSGIALPAGAARNVNG